jgi:MFS family permease
MEPDIMNLIFTANQILSIFISPADGSPCVWHGPGPFMPLNARLFILFRLLFNCRFYYPVFTVLFLDLGLGIGEFAALNVIWALTIVLLEVPSGALADQFGRRRLMITAGLLMVAEMAVLCVMPVGDHDAVLWLFVINRILSGAAEACASGADEALAYDSLPEAERPVLWPRLMARLQRAMAVGFIISSISGSLLYTHEYVTAAAAFLGLPEPSRALTLKVPLALNLLSAIACLITCLRMREPEAPEPLAHSLFVRTRLAFRGIVTTGRWIWGSQAVLRLLVLGVVFDSIIRLFLTVSSNFYRLVGISESWYGVIGTASSLLGLLTAGMMELTCRRFSLAQNFAGLALTVFGGLLAAAHPQPGWTGVILILPLMLGMRFLQFYLSHYLNAEVDSAHRATTLSFRGLTMNIAYGGMTLLFGWHTHWLAGQSRLTSEDTRVFADSLAWWPWWFAGTLLVSLLCLRLHRLRRA